MHYIFNRLKLTSKRRLGVGFALLAIVVIGGFVLRHSMNNTDSVGSPGVDEVTGINYNGPTEEEKRQSEDNKQRAVDQMNIDAQAPSPSGQKKAVTVSITSASQNNSQIEVFALVSGITEDDGTCTFEFSKQSIKVSKTTAGVRDATTTICTPVRFDSSELATGNWTVTLRYQSNNAQGDSAPVTFKVE